jgi:hypothetical protein
MRVLATDVSVNMQLLGAPSYLYNPHSHPNMHLKLPPPHMRQTPIPANNLNQSLSFGEIGVGPAARGALQG